MLGLGDRQELAQTRDFRARRSFPRGSELIEAAPAIRTRSAWRTHLGDPTSAQQSFYGSVQSARTHINAARRPRPHIHSDSMTVLRPIHESEKHAELGRWQRKVGHRQPPK
jgi:hypothetical protein